MMESMRNMCGPGAASDPEVLQDLIPIAVVVAAGCEPCAEKMVRRALQQGSSRRQILKAIAIIEDLQRSGCFQAAVSQEVRDRMVKPLQRARSTAEEPAAGSPTEAGKGSCC